VKLGNEAVARTRRGPSLAFTYDSEYLRIQVAAREGNMAAVHRACARGRSRRVREDDSFSVYIYTAGDVYELTVAGDGKLDDVCWSNDQEDPSWAAGA